MRKVKFNIMEELELTHEFLLTNFSYKDGKLYHLTYRPNKWKPGYILGGPDRNEYWGATVLGKKYANSRLVFFYHKGYLPTKVDHIDRDPCNDKIENLRECTDMQNTWNTTKRINTVSKYKGVQFDKRVVREGSKKWKASITVNKKVISLGYFLTEKEAGKAYNKAAKKHFGEFANLNKL